MLFVLRADLPKQQGFTALSYCLLPCLELDLTSSADISGKQGGDSKPWGTVATMAQRYSESIPAQRNY